LALRDRLGLKELRALCMERGFKGCGSLYKADLVQRIAERVGVVPEC
jgi:hypothetical protein